MAASDPQPVAPPEPETLVEMAATFPQLELLEYIGGGGMGRVYKARQPQLDRLVALKVLPPELGHDPTFAERFVREGRALARLNHPNIVSIFDFGRAGKFFYLLMEYVDGVNLRQAMRTGLTPREALSIVPKICEALQYAHDHGVLHRDIKPENILIDTGGQVKIADFGVAKMGGEDRPQITLTVSGAALGTPHYMAPEQIEHPQEVDHRADIYSLGVVFYEMLTGGLPIGRFPAPSEKSGTDPRLDQVVFRTLEKERDRRYQTAREVKSQVEFVTNAPRTNEARPPGQQRVPANGTTSQKATWSLVLTLLGLLLFLPWMITFRVSRSDQAQRIESQQMVRSQETAMQAINAELAEAQKELAKMEATQAADPKNAILWPQIEDLRHRVATLQAKSLTLPIGPVQTVANSSPTGGIPIVGLLVIGLQLACLTSGLALGFAALADIRRSGGALGGAISAAIGAGLLPGSIIVVLTGIAGRTLSHEAGIFGRRGDLLLFASVGLGIWFAFLLLRSLYRRAVCWMPPQESGQEADRRSSLGTMALWFAVAGTFCLFFFFSRTSGLIIRGADAVSLNSALPWVSLGLLLASVVLGLAAGKGSSKGKAAWVLGTIMIGIELLSFS